MNCLLERLSTCKETDFLWIAAPDCYISVSKLTRVLGSIPPSDWHNKRVAIGNLPLLELVSTLVFLDGLAQSIVLLPNEDDAQTREARLMQAGIDVLLEGDGLGFATLLAEYDCTDWNDKAHQSIAVRPTAIQTAWLLPTSGTTGTPKLISHTLTSLTRSMTKRRVGNKYTWGSLYSLRRFAGLQVFLQSWMCATPLILNEDEAPLHEVLTRFSELGCNALSATPSMWRKLAMHPLFDRLALEQITLGGELVDQAVLDMLANRFPSARITHIYASTEAGVGYIVTDRCAGFPTEYLLQPPLGVAMRIDERNHLWLRSTTERSLAMGTDNNWIDSGDVVEIDADRVRILGRVNGSINVGGSKVMPEEIESVIKELTDVAFVHVRARKSTILGNLVEAAITPLPGIDIDIAFKKRVTAHCRKRLDGFKVPAFIVAADDIELTSSGKLSRIDTE